MKINPIVPAPKTIQRVRDLLPNTFYVDKDGEVHFTNNKGILAGFFNKRGQYTPWYDSVDDGDIRDLSLSIFDGTLSN